MNQIEDIFSVVKYIHESIPAATLDTELENLNRISQLYSTNSAAAVQQTISSVDRLMNLLKTIDTKLWTAEHLQAAEKLDVRGIIGDSGRQFLESVKLQVQQRPRIGPNQIQVLITRLNKLRTKPRELFTLLEPFNIQTNFEKEEPDIAFIEIIFDENVAIDSFSSAREQMNDWLLIVDGYSRLLNANKEDFVIVGIFKSSPAKFKVKTTLKNAALVIGIVTNILLAEKTLIENRIMIQKLKESDLLDQEEVKRQFVESAERKLREKIDSNIEKIVEEKIHEYAVQGDQGDIRASFAKSVQNQYNFVVNGGEVTVYVLDDSTKIQVTALEKAKDDIREIKHRHANQKILRESNE